MIRKLNYLQHLTSENKHIFTKRQQNKGTKRQRERETHTHTKSMFKLKRESMFKTKKILHINDKTYFKFKSHRLKWEKEGKC